MGILDFLRKVGVLKSGSGSWKGNVKDQSAEDVLAGDFYSNKKDESDETEKKKEENNMTN
ncbi:MAG: hypothetical protein KAT04_05355 [Methylococcales bacterium]|nr:hypothetical protein [Candidatus Moranbacteria bacterium]MCK4841294.1 hypothetical protein [Methylococcales bacterium]